MNNQKTKPLPIIPFAVFLIAFVVYALSPTVTNTDSAYTFHVAASILQHGDINLDEYSHLLDLKNDYRVMVVNGHIYSYYPTATPLLAVPVAWVANMLFPLRYSTDFYTYLAEHKPDQRTGKMEQVIASFICALAAVVMYMIAKQFLNAKAALFLTAIFAFASPMYSSSSRALWQHGPSVLTLSLALYFVILSNAALSEDGNESKRATRLLLLAGFFLALSYIIRPTNSLSIIFLSLYILQTNRGRFIPFAAMMALIFFLFVAHSWTTYGSFLPPYSFQLFNRFGTIHSFFNAFAGIMVSPNRGLLIFSPVFFFSLYGIYHRVRQKRFTLASLEPYMLAICIVHWLITSTFDQWDGGWTLGPRYMADITPYFTFFLIPVFDLWGFATHCPSNAVQAIASKYRLVGIYSVFKKIFIGAVVVSIAIQAYVSISPYPFYWSGKPESLVEVPSRVWDWSDLQFLRGLCSDDPLEGKAPSCWFK